MERNNFKTAIFGTLFFLFSNFMPNFITATEKKENYKVLVDVDECRLELYQDNKKIRDFKVATGESRAETPLGKYNILKKENWGGKFAGTYLQFLKNLDENGKDQGGWGIHGTDKLWSLGYLLSNGCIRMYPGDAAYLKKTLPVGTEIEFVYDTIDVKDNILKITNDIYNKGTNSLENVLKKLSNAGIETDKIDKEKLNDVLESVKEETILYNEAAKKVNDIYHEYDKRKWDYTGLDKANVQAGKLLREMLIYSKREIDIKEILK